MEAQTKYSVEDIVKIVMALPPKDRETVQKEIQKALLDKEDILNRMEPFHKKYEDTFKKLA